MRLTDEQVQIIRQVARQQLGDTVEVTLFGSRVFDDKKGGDIDLFFETEQVLANKANAICQLYAALIMKLGDRKIDVVIKDADSSDQPIYEIAKRTGIKL